LSLSNALEPPGTTFTGRPVSSGTVTFTYKVVGQDVVGLSFVATVNNIDFTGQTPATTDNATNAHIHAGGPGFVPAPGNTTGVVWGFLGTPQHNTSPFDTVVTPLASGVGATISATWDPNEGSTGSFASQAANILAGRAYINFHTNENPGGEIRAFLPAVPEPSSIIMLGTGAVALVTCGWRSRRQGR